VNIRYPPIAEAAKNTIRPAHPPTLMQEKLIRGARSFQLFPACTRAGTMSAPGHSETFPAQDGMSASPLKADIATTTRNVGYGPEADICLSRLSLNNSVSPQQERPWYHQSKQFGRLEIDGGPLTEAPGCLPCHCRKLNPANKLLMSGCAGGADS
jgi:hypothetical protein